MREAISDNGGMTEAIEELVEMYVRGGPITQNKIALSLAERARIAEGKARRLESLLQIVKRHLFGMVDATWKSFDDQEADEFIARIIKGAERKKK